MENDSIHRWADSLIQAERRRTPVSPLTQSGLSSVAQAYQVQGLVLAHKTASGARRRGKKIGLTSVAMQRQFGVFEPDYGELLSDMELSDGAEVRRDALIQPRVEPEVAFVLERPLKGPGVTPGQVLQATAYVLPALEIADSRIVNWTIQLPDTVADNASSGLYVLGMTPCSVRGIDLSTVGMTLEQNGKIEQLGVGAAVLGHPAQSVAWLINRLADYDEGLEAGDVVLSGSLSQALELNAGDVILARFGNGLGTVRMVCTP